MENFTYPVKIIDFQRIVKGESALFRHARIPDPGTHERFTRQCAPDFMIEAGQRKRNVVSPFFSPEPRRAGRI
ncbi:MAG: hypothetical protein LBB28_02155, partial [Synergistaceae bacterium]|jgi:hypothetical protein|nr:hypothetical protein [Synergistaceae bacterium]